MAAPNKKPEAKPADDTGLYIIIIFAIIAVVIFGMGTLFDLKFINIEYFFSKIFTVLGPIGRALVDTHTWFVVGVVSSIISVFCLAVIIFSAVRMREIQNFEKFEIEHEISLALARDQEISDKENPRWKYVLSLIESPSESDWRMAIIEADSMLDDLLIEKGYSGDSLGERLKNARSDAFMTIDNAWAAHEVRNKIAHSGLDYSLTQLESRRIMRLYETVFEELGLL
ncbi:MAG: hypothetical protein QG566_467 [Patescibacteria group bacterium]|jgi:hypothetical protein|nr:hypothetical protein [Patescibacteria group bacterium]